MQPSSDDISAMLAGLGLVIILILLAVALMVHLVYAYFFKRICQNCGGDPGVLVWIPILQFIPIVQAARLSTWMFLLVLVPFVNYFFLIYLYWKLSEACGKRGELGLMAIFPPLLLILIPLLAFTGSRAQPAPVQTA